MWRQSWIALVVTVAAMFAVNLSAQWKTHWSYSGPAGPEHWSRLDPDYAACGGREQSPIDIVSPVKASLPAIRFFYTSSPLEHLVDNGYTIRVNYDAAQRADVMVVGDIRYALTQFHFHRPSEELVHGVRYDMVLHLMHVAANGPVAGVAVFLKAGRPNAVVQQLWDHLPKTKGGEDNVPAVEIDPARLLPRDLTYYTYDGSLTAPPCTEGVTWFVLKTPVEISPGQIAAFAKRYPHDIRPAQPLNGRVVRESR
ncbi:MAG TPA: carbonic anhydrase family protein [Vicinamibacterales bacterium]